MLCKFYGTCLEAKLYEYTVWTTMINVKYTLILKTFSIICKCLDCKNPFVATKYYQLEALVLEIWGWHVFRENKNKYMQSYYSNICC